MQSDAASPPAAEVREHSPTAQPQVISHIGSDEDLSHEKAVWDQYRAWKKHIPNLYEHLTVHPLEWPALTLDWLPEDDNRDEEGYTKNYLLLGTQAFEPPSEEEQRAAAEAATSWEEKKPAKHVTGRRGAHQVGINFIYNLRCYLPSLPECGFTLTDQFYRHAGKVELQQRIPHEAGVVNVLRHMPQNPHLVASRGPARGQSTSQIAPVFIYDLDAAPDLHYQAAMRRRQGGAGPAAAAVDGQSCPPLLSLYGHSQEGMTLSWNKKRHGLIASGADDCRILIWDLEDKIHPDALAEFENAGLGRHRQKNGVMPCMELKSASGTAHDEAVQCVDFHATHEHLLFSVGDDKAMRIWDTRVYDRGFVQGVKPAHSSNINCVQAHPFADHVVATCGCDGVVKIWDIRFLRRSRHNQIEANMILRGHSDEVTCLEWAPHCETVLATGSRDRTVIIWDIEKHGQRPFETGTIDCCGGFFNRLLPAEWRAPPKPQFSADDLDIPPDIMFVHFGHTAPVTDISWNPSEDWVIASASEDNFLHLWQVADRIRSESVEDPVLSPAVQMQEAVPMHTIGGQAAPVDQEMQGGPTATTVAAAPLQPTGSFTLGNAAAASPGQAAAAPLGPFAPGGSMAAPPGPPPSSEPPPPPSQAPRGSLSPPVVNPYSGARTADAAPSNSGGAAAPGDVLAGTPDV